MRFTSETAFKALSARGGHALIRKYGRKPPWLERCRQAGLIVRVRKGINTKVSNLDDACRRLSLEMEDVIAEYRAQQAVEAKRLAEGELERGDG